MLNVDDEKLEHNKLIILRYLQYKLHWPTKLVTQSLKSITLFQISEEDKLVIAKHSLDEHNFLSTKLSREYQNPHD